MNTSTRNGFGDKDNKSQESGVFIVLDTLAHLAFSEMRPTFRRTSGIRGTAVWEARNAPFVCQMPSDALSWVTIVKMDDKLFVEVI